MIFITENDYDEIINHHCDQSLMQKTDSFSGITAFVAAAQHGSFTAAADKPGITKYCSVSCGSRPITALPW
ncbi:TPA: LysR family transcriptional regulator [Morganella morganii subsp. morganii]|uniref:Uncharacterized protein n=1 Tax=Morganella morganii TaxID=582 RepID=A0AAU8ZQV5_MORMO|nr:LysR family transcriptional regulator [Morganella morganii]HDU8691714.1 LysR family transcriptional regulator [Morganella morganii subsp. morganii]AWC95160.1 hypothetical protein AM380_16680 [Morganella morganii]EKW8484317.1 LysR family transcriptional regulator [Morganella morganii]HAT3623366.1 LysR family transcriptional regulator [Morganella morganii]HCU0876829.1 LysR family transcriptional regulator [Morganella morganii]